MRYQIAEDNGGGNRSVLYEAEFEDADAVEAHLRLAFAPEAQSFLDIEGDDRCMYVTLSEHMCCGECLNQTTCPSGNGLSACPGGHPIIPEIYDEDDQDCDNWVSFYMEAVLID